MLFQAEITVLLGTSRRQRPWCCLGTYPCEYSQKDGIVSLRQLRTIVLLPCEVIEGGLFFSR
jgi:hypothetical protein